MSPRETSIRLIERYYDAFNAGDHDAMLACLSDNVAHDINQGMRERGKIAFRAFLERQDRAYVEFLSDVVIMASQDGRRASAEFIVIGEYRVEQAGLPPAHGQHYELPAAAYFSIDDDLISRVTVYYNLAEWILQVAH